MNQQTNDSRGEYPELHLGYPTTFEADRGRQFRKFDRVIQLSGFDDILATPESRLEYIDSLTLETFEPLLKQINGIQINLPKSYRKYTDNMQVIIGDELFPQDIMPAPQDKQRLLGIVLEHVQRTPDLEDKAFLLAMGITTVHPFDEGNGRLARSLYHLLSEGYTPNDPKLREIMGVDGESIITPDPNVLRPIIMGNMKIELGTHVYDPVTHTPVPRLILGVGTDNYNPLNTLAPDLNPELAEDVAGMLLQQDMKEMLPFLLAKVGKSQAALAAIRSPKHDPNAFFFILDQFWANMTNDDLSAIHAIAIDLKYVYATRVMEQLSLGDKSMPMLMVDNSGEYVMEPAAITMKRIFKGEFDVSPDAVATRLALKGSQSAVAQKSKLTRQERRAKERKEAKAAKRSAKN